MSVSQVAQKVAGYIKSLGSDFKWYKCPFPYDHMGASIVDASLQAGVDYDSVVLPRVEYLRREYAHYKKTTNFSTLLEKVPLKDLIRWNHKEKLTRVKDALNLFLKENVETEKDLFDWIQNEINQKKLKNCRGVGPKTLDYYKLLSGHSTLAIDRHLQNFVREARF